MDFVPCLGLLIAEYAKNIFEIGSFGFQTHVSPEILISNFPPNFSSVLSLVKLESRCQCFGFFVRRISFSNLLPIEGNYRIAAAPIVLNQSHVICCGGEEKYALMSFSKQIYRPFRLRERNGHDL